MKKILAIAGLLVAAGGSYWFLRDDGRITVDSVSYLQGNPRVYTAHLHTRKVDYNIQCDEYSNGAVCWTLSAGERHSFTAWYGKVMEFADQEKDTKLWTIVTQKTR